MPSPSDVWVSARAVDERIMKLWAEKPWKEDLSGRRYATYSSYYGPVTDHFVVTVDDGIVVVLCTSEAAREFADRHVSVNATGIPVRILMRSGAVTHKEHAADKAARKKEAKAEREKKSELQAERERYQRNMLGRPQ